MIRAWEHKVSILAIFIAVILTVYVIFTVSSKKAPISGGGSPRAEVVLHPKDRLLILAPHPDDEVLGCGGIIQQALAKDIPVHIVFFTYGDFYEWSFIIYKKRPVLTAQGVLGMGEIRHDEALGAASVLGLSKEDVEFLGYPDFGTLDIWNRAWRQAQPVKGILTKATAVPYANAVRPGAPYKGEEVLQDLISIICKFRPTKIFVSHPADYHPDHRALYLFTRVALFGLEKEISPEVYTYLVHYTKWPMPEGYFPNEPLEPPSFLRECIPWQIYSLSSQGTATKLAALEKHQTQCKTASKFLKSFVRRNELFGEFPTITLSSQALSHSLLENIAHVPTEKTEIVEDDKTFLIGVVHWTVNFDSDALVLSIELTSPLTKESNFSVYLCGYRNDTVFSEMPKLHIEFGPLTHKIYDMDKEVPFDRIQIMRSMRDIRIRVPLEVMGRPQKILTSVRTYAGAIPLDWGPWRILVIAMD